MLPMSILGTWLFTLVAGTAFMKRPPISVSMIELRLSKLSSASTASPLVSGPRELKLILTAAISWRRKMILPVIFYVFSTSGGTVGSVIFAIWCVLVGLCDNVLKPLLMGRGSRTPMLVLFMGSLGGFMAGGILGLFVGAVVLSIGYTVFMAWLEESGLVVGSMRQ